MIHIHIDRKLKVSVCLFVFFCFVSIFFAANSLGIAQTKLEDIPFNKRLGDDSFCSQDMKEIIEWIKNNYDFFQKVPLKSTITMRSSQQLICDGFDCIIPHIEGLLLQKMLK